MNTKKLLIIICILANQFFNTVNAQAPQSFNYQAVARDASGAVLSNQAVSFRISLLQGSATGTNVYSETHPVTTNQFGLVNFAIGGGTIVSGSFGTINWAQGPYFVQVELDATGGSTYVIMNTTQLLSVPYAQYAEKSGNPTLQAGSGITIQNDSIINTAQNQQINLSGTGQTNITGTYPNYVVNTPNIQAGNGISVTGQTITNTAPDQTVILNGTGQTNVTGTYPNFTVNTPPYTAGTGINISGTNISAQNTNAIWNANKLQGKNIDTLTPVLGNVLEYDGSKWKPSDKLPQMTTAQREALTNLYSGMMILNTNTDCIEYYTGTNWLGLCGEEGNVGSSLTGGDLIGINPILISECPASNITGGEVMFEINGKLYFKVTISGNQTFWEYNVAISTWTQRATYPNANFDDCFAINGKGYVKSNSLVEFSEYDVTTNVWTTLDNSTYSFNYLVDLKYLCNVGDSAIFYSFYSQPPSWSSIIYFTPQSNNWGSISGFPNPYVNNPFPPMSPGFTLSNNKIWYCSTYGGGKYLWELDLNVPNMKLLSTFGNIGPNSFFETNQNFYSMFSNGGTLQQLYKYNAFAYSFVDKNQLTDKLNIQPTNRKQVYYINGKTLFCASSKVYEIHP